MILNDLECECSMSQGQDKAVCFDECGGETCLRRALDLSLGADQHAFSTSSETTVNGAMGKTDVCATSECPETFNQYSRHKPLLSYPFKHMH